MVLHLRMARVCYLHAARAALRATPRAAAAWCGSSRHLLWRGNLRLQNREPGRWARAATWPRGAQISPGAPVRLPTLPPPVDTVSARVGGYLHVQGRYNSCTPVPGTACWLCSLQLDGV